MDKKENGSIRKQDIGSPTHFVHLSPLGKTEPQFFNDPIFEKRVEDYIKLFGIPKDEGISLVPPLNCIPVQPDKTQQHRPEEEREEEIGIGPVKGEKRSMKIRKHDIGYPTHFFHLSPRGKQEPQFFDDPLFEQRVKHYIEVFKTCPNDPMVTAQLPMNRHVEEGLIGIEPESRSIRRDKMVVIDGIIFCDLECHTVITA